MTVGKYGILFGITGKCKKDTMPILDIEIVAPDSAPDLPANLTQSLADKIAQVLESPDGTVWVKVRVIPSTQYAENVGVPDGVHPVFVTVLRSRVPEGSALENEIAQLTQVIANALNRPTTNVHIFYQQDAVGRAAFGGKLVS